jgi:hypothetical protein
LKGEIKMAIAKKEEMNLTPEEQMQKAIEAGKKKHGKVYKTILADEAIIWRKLKRSEYKEVMNMFVYEEVKTVDEEGKEIIDQRIDEEATFDMRQEEIAKRVILYPAANKIVEDMAAVADVISTECMVKSGFGERTPQTTEC